MRIGIDLGGTKIELVVLDGSDVRYRKRVPTPASYDEVVTTLSQLVLDAEREVGATCSVGLGTPGAISPATGLLKNCNAASMNGHPLDRDLSRVLGRTVRMQNDANCFALSEASDGAARGAEVAFGVILGTGCGGAIVVRGAIVTGRNAIAGEWGHNPLPWPGPHESPGPRCYCGRAGCIETYVSGTGIARDHAHVTGHALSAPEIVAQAGLGQADAVATLERYCDRLARALASVINVLDPDVIVVGGGMSNTASLYTEVPKLWGRYVYSDRVDTKLVPALHGDASGVRGAAWLWP